jgi:mannosyltransferase OCH1-like enzyme
MHTLFIYSTHFFSILKQAFFNPYINSIVTILELLHIRKFVMLNIIYRNKYFKSIPFKKTDITCKKDITIPKCIYLCYKTKNIPTSILRDIKTLNPGWTVELYDDIMCRDFISDNYGETLSNLFTNIKDGPIKADLFRICILYKKGGVYTDIDNVLLRPIDDIIQKNITFAVGGSYDGLSLNPAFLVSCKENPILLKCIETYENIIIKIPYSYWDYSIVHCMTYVLQSYILIENKSQTVELPEYNQKIQVFEEKLDYYTYTDLFKCMFDLNRTIENYMCLFDTKNDKIIALHSDIYDSELHCLR